MHYRNLGLSVRKTQIGQGVFATKTFRKGQSIGAMQGQIITGDDYDPAYVVDITGGVFDPAAPWRYLNHCCEPNAQLFEEEATARKPPSIVVVALKTVRRGDQVTIDYGWPADEFSLRCLCGAAACRGWVVADTELDKMKRLAKRLAQPRSRTQRLAPAAE